MANKEKGEVDFQLGGESYRFKLGTNALIELQECFADTETVARMHAEAETAQLKTALLKYGSHQGACKGTPCQCGLKAALFTTNGKGSVPPVEAIVKEVQSGRLKYVRAFLWAGLLKFHPGMTQDRVSDLIDDANESEVKKLLFTLGLTTQPDPADVKELMEGTTKANPRKARTKRGSGAASGSTPVESV